MEDQIKNVFHIAPRTLDEILKEEGLYLRKNDLFYPERRIGLVKTPEEFDELYKTLSEVMDEVLSKVKEKSIPLERVPLEEVLQEEKQ